MTKEGFIEYLKAEYPVEGSRAAASYKMSIDILDNIFSKMDVFDLHGKSLCLVDDLELLLKISDFVRLEEAKFRENEEGFFALGNPRQKSYPKGRFCSAAMKSLINYYGECKKASAQQIVDRSRSGAQLSKKLAKLFDINKTSGEDIVRETKTRLGQSYFRRLVLANYDNKCCITGLNIPQTLRASHIVAWAEDKANRMNPENGLCLSATYDAAFDKHLISFDDNYCMIVSKEIKDYYTNETVRKYFENYEGTQLNLPSRFLPNKELLAKHRELLVG